ARTLRPLLLPACAPRTSRDRTKAAPAAARAAQALQLILRPRTSGISPSNSASSYFRIVEDKNKAPCPAGRAGTARPPASSVGEQLTPGVDPLRDPAHLPFEEFVGHPAQIAQGGDHRSAPCHDCVISR